MKTYTHIILVITEPCTEETKPTVEKPRGGAEDSSLTEVDARGCGRPGTVSVHKSASMN